MSRFIPVVSGILEKHETQAVHTCSTRYGTVTGRGTSIYKMLADEAELQVWRKIEVAFPSAGHREAGVKGAG